MNAFPDTSFLCAIYRQQDNSGVAAARFEALTEPLPVTGLLLYEFRQSLRFQVWLHAQDARRGFSQRHGDRALADLQSDLDTGAVGLVAADWPDVHRLAERLSSAHTAAGGHRTMDILHVATALHLGAREFLTFDANQRKLALVGKLKVRL